MLKTDLAGRMTRLLISVCVVSAGLGVSIIQSQAGEMPGLFWKESACCDSTEKSMTGSACNCPHCREANSADLPLLRFFKSHRTKWSERPPKNSWKHYHPCPPYFQPGFGVYQTSWSILPYDECQVPFAMPPVDADDLLPIDTESRPSPTPVPPETLNEPMQGSIITTAPEISTCNSDSNVRGKMAFPAIKSSEKLKRWRESLRQESSSGTDIQRQHPKQTDLPSPQPATSRTKLVPEFDVPTRASSDAIVPPMGSGFVGQTPDSVFASQDQPFFQTHSAVALRAVPRLK